MLQREFYATRARTSHFVILNIMQHQSKLWPIMECIHKNIDYNMINKTFVDHLSISFVYGSP